MEASEALTQSEFLMVAATDHSIFHKYPRDSRRRLDTTGPQLQVVKKYSPSSVYYKGHCMSKHRCSRVYNAVTFPYLICGHDGVLVTPHPLSSKPPVPSQRKTETLDSRDTLVRDFTNITGNSRQPDPCTLLVFSSCLFAVVRADLTPLEPSFFQDSLTPHTKTTREESRLREKEQQKRIRWSRR